LKECPRCFWLNFKKGVQRPETPFPSLPSGMDKVLKEHFDRFMEKGELPPELKTTECEKNGCKLFSDKEKLKIWRSNFRGIEYKDEKLGILLHGAIDNLLIKGKKLIVLDYKTRGFPLKKDTHEHYIDQMDIYNFLLREHGYETEDYSYLLFYYPTSVIDNGDVIFHTELVKLKVDIKKAQNIIKNALNILDGDIPNPSKDCGFCKWVDMCKT
jgi:hypothetical protein